MTEPATSISPNGEIFPLPQPEDYPQELERLKTIVADQRAQGREIVVVMGLGFVGAVMAGVIADSVDKWGHVPEARRDRNVSPEHRNRKNLSSVCSAHHPGLFGRFLT